MRTTIDKIDTNPPHAFSPQELKSFLRLLPKELLRDVSVVRLSGAILHSALFYTASFCELEQRLVIVSRGKKRRDVMFAVVSHLALCNLRRPGEKKYHQLPPAEILRYSNAIVAEIESKMPLAPHWNRAELRYVSQSRAKKPAQALGADIGSIHP